MDITNAAALAVVGIIIGGRILSIITLAPVIIRNWSIVSSDIHILYELMSNGMVFYGGLFGAIISINIYQKKYSLDKNIFWDYICCIFPLFHAIGRIGCFLTGCCHGLPSQHFDISYTESVVSANGVPYFPIQLVSSLIDFLLFGFLIIYEKRHHKQGKALQVYLFAYAVCRFIIEFFRGDSIRGFVFGLSTSQWIGLGVVIYLVINHFTKQQSRKAIQR